MPFSGSRSALCLVVSLIWVPSLLVTPAQGQGIDLPPLEVVGFGGVSGGLDDLAGLETFPGGTVPSGGLDGLSDVNWNVGGGVGARFTDTIMGRFDVVRTHLFSTEVDLGGGDFVEVGTSLMEFTFGAEYLFNDTGLAPMVPFVGAGVGFARVGLNVRASIGGESFDVGAGDTGGTVNLGGGIRIQATEKLGFRPQFQFVAISGESFWRALFGFYYALN